MRRHHDKVEMPIAHITEEDLRRITSLKTWDYYPIAEFPSYEFVHFFVGSRDQTLIGTVGRGDLDDVKRGDFGLTLHCHRVDRNGGSIATLREIHRE